MRLALMRKAIYATFAILPLTYCIYYFVCLPFNAHTLLNCEPSLDIALRLSPLNDQLRNVRLWSSLVFTFTLRSCH